MDERCLPGGDNSKACCDGIKHEARDFTREMLLHLLDHFERNDNFIEFMKRNEFLEMDSYQTIVANIEKRRENISPGTAGCEECEEEGTEWAYLRLCLTCLPQLSHFLS
jgi:hypothetical protein